MTTSSPLRTIVGELEFQNPIVLAAGTAGYGEELAGVMRLEAIGGFVTKAVSLAPRDGAPAPRVAEFDGGMINAVGLANPGLEAVRRDQIPWLAANLRGTRKLVNVVGFTVDDYPAIVAGLEEALTRYPGAADGFELNVSCPNTKAGGMEFGADPAALRAPSSRALGGRLAVRSSSRLSPVLPNIADAAQIAVDFQAPTRSARREEHDSRDGRRRRAAAAGAGVRDGRRQRSGQSARWRAGDLEGSQCGPWRSRSSASGASKVGNGDALQYVMAGRFIGWGRHRGHARSARPGANRSRTGGVVPQPSDSRHCRRMCGTLEWPT